MKTLFYITILLTKVINCVSFTQHKYIRRHQPIYSNIVRNVDENYLSVTKSSITIGDSIIDYYEPLYSNNKNTDSVLFFTGLDSIMPGDIYGDFLSTLSSFNNAIYVASSDTTTNQYLIKHMMTQFKSVTVIGHSSGGIGALKITQQFDNITKCVLLDPVDNSMLKKKNKKTFFGFNIDDNTEIMGMNLESLNVTKLFDVNEIISQITPKFTNPFTNPFKQKSVSCDNLDSVLFINADKSYEWKFFPVTVPFIPIFGIKPQSIENKTKYVLNVNGFGHADILDKLWSNTMHATLCKGSEDRNPQTLYNYQEFLSFVIKQYIQNTLTNDAPKNYRNNDIKFDFETIV
tara:strand:+ start:12254 stop:13291 length:1038 start_codon:yes stop_codon:yes gene_type:complete